MTRKSYVRGPLDRFIAVPAREDARHVVVLTTLESIGDARAFVRELVNRGVVACGTIAPSATSIYRWEGKITETTEAVVLLKTSQERWQDLVDATNELHPYKVPELLSVPVEAGLERYLAWVSSETIESRKKESP